MVEPHGRCDADQRGRLIAIWLNQKIEEQRRNPPPYPPKAREGEFRLCAPCQWGEGEF